MALASIKTFVNTLRKGLLARASKFNLFAERSLQRRYLYAAALFIVLMVTIAIVGQYIIKGASDRHLNEVHRNTMVSDQLRNLLLRTGTLETAIQRFIITSTTKVISGMHSWTAFRHRILSPSQGLVGGRASRRAC